MSWLRRFFILIRLLGGRVREYDQRIEALEKAVYGLKEDQKRMLAAYRADHYKEFGSEQISSL